MSTVPMSSSVAQALRLFTLADDGVIEDRFSELSKAELVAACASRGLDSSGKMAQMRTLLREEDARKAKVKKAKREAAAAAAAAEEDEDEDSDPYASMARASLQNLCRRRGLDEEGKPSQLRTRLRERDAERVKERAQLKLKVTKLKAAANVAAAAATAAAAAAASAVAEIAAFDEEDEGGDDDDEDDEDEGSAGAPAAAKPAAASAGAAASPSAPAAAPAAVTLPPVTAAAVPPEAAPTTTSPSAAAVHSAAAPPASSTAVPSSAAAAAAVLPEPVAVATPPPPSVASPAVALDTFEIAAAASSTPAAEATTAVVESGAAAESEAAAVGRAAAEGGAEGETSSGADSRAVGRASSSDGGSGGGSAAPSQALTAATAAAEEKRLRDIAKHGPTLDGIISGLREAGLKSSQMCVFVDCTKSNLEKGAKSFGGRSLHDVSDASRPNPYLQVMAIIGRTLSGFDADGLIPCFGFGDKVTADHSVFPLFDTKAFPKGCAGYDELAKSYASRIVGVELAGPTSYAPAIRKTIELVKASKPMEFTIALLLVDGAPTSKADTDAAIIEASKLPIVIIIVGLGDGPWDLMHRLDDDLPERKFDNVNFVEFSAVAKQAVRQNISLSAALAMDCLVEIPKAFEACNKMGMFKKW